MFAHIQQYVGKVPFNWGVLPVDPKSGFYIVVHSVHLSPHVSWNGILVFISGRRALLYLLCNTSNTLLSQPGRASMALRTLVE